MVAANVGTMGGDDFDFEAIYEAKLIGLGGGGAGHAAGEGVEGGEVLEGDGGEDAAFAARGKGFLGFEGGVEAGGPAAVGGGDPAPIGGCTFAASPLSRLWGILRSHQSAAVSLSTPNFAPLAGASSR